MPETSIGRNPEGRRRLSILDRSMRAALAGAEQSAPGRLSRYEANVPTQEAQARPYARVSCAHAHACRPPHDQAPAQEGPLAPDRLTGPGRWTGRRERLRHRRPRLTRSADFDRVYRQGRSAASRYFVLYAFPRATRADPAPSTRSEMRLGVSVGGAWVARSSATASSGCCARPSGRSTDAAAAEPRLRGRRAAGAAETGGPGGLDGVQGPSLAALARAARLGPSDREARAVRPMLASRRCSRPDPALPAVHLAAAAAPLQVRADLLGLCRRGGPRAWGPARDSCWRSGGCCGATRSATAGTTRSAHRRLFR